MLHFSGTLVFVYFASLVMHRCNRCNIKVCTDNRTLTFKDLNDIMEELQ